VAVIVVLQYLLERGESQISHQVGEKMMSIAEQLRQEGELKIAKRMLAENSARFIKWKSIC
jgi:hypothetical protein